jgi:hypothetical protein
MTHNEVYEKFKLYFPNYSGERVDCYFPNGKNSIRIRQTNMQEFIFSFVSDTEWSFETVNFFMKRRLYS